MGHHPTFFLPEILPGIRILKPNSKEALEQLQNEVEQILAPMGYELVALEHSTAGGRKITLYVDFLNNQSESRRVGLDDCLTVNRAVDELFETTPLVDGHYTLEVSSPGVERPLRKVSDYSRFSGKKVKLHTFRPLEKEESENAAYWEKNKKQKNFIGTLEGLAEDSSTASSNESKVKLNIDGQHVKIPLALISKAHLEIDFEIVERSQ